MSSSKIARLGIGAALVLAVVALVSCNGAGTLPPGEAYLTIYNPNTSTTNAEYYYSEIFIDNKAVSPSTIYAGGQQNYVVTAPGTHQLQLKFTASSSQTPATTTAQLSVPTLGCTYTGPTTLGGAGSGC